MLARTFLRLCTLEALRPSSQLTAASPVWPTLAANYVSDSKIDPIDDVSGDERRPLIAVYTEDGDLTKIAQGGPLMYKGDVDLTFEISVVGKFAVDGGSPIIDYCDTDAATEAALDQLEDQIFFCLHYGPTGDLFRQMSKLPFDSWHSSVHRSGEEAIKLAKRTIKARIRMKEVCYQGAPATTPTDLGRLPPALQSIAQSLNGSTYLQALVLGLAHSASVMPNATPLNTVGMTAAPNGNNSVQQLGVTLTNLQGQT